MNTLFKAIVLSISTALVAAPVMAAPQDHQTQSQSKYSHKAPAPQHNAKSQQSHPTAFKAPQYNKHAKKVDPSRDWRVGQKVPQQFYASSYKVEHSKYKKLSKPGKNQQWIKVNGDYILTNTFNHSIVKIIAG